MTFLNTNDYRNLYGERTTIRAKHLEKLIRKQAKTKHHIRFLKECKNNDLIPKGFIIKNNTNNYKNKEIINDTMRKIRNNTL